MSKRRKYDIKNKRSFIIIVILSIVIIGIFSLFIYKYSKTSSIEYTIDSGTILQDVLKNYITVDDDAKLKIRWNGNYYLEYNDEKISLGKKVIAYNTVTGGMKLYGTFYEILSDGKIIENKNETVLHNTTEAKFFKLDDREYLLVDSKIYSDDFSIETTNYLLVELDKGGNAKLSNNKINLKTISPTTLVTTKYTFDIANEILNFGEFNIDLKKIIGSTNQYVPESSGDGDNTDNEEDDDNSTENKPNNNVSNNVGTGVTGPGTGGVVNNTDTGKEEDMEEILDKVKMTSIVRVSEGLNQIDIDYVIYDPYNEYGSVYVEVKSMGKVDIVYLSKIDTHLTLYNLNANTEYTLKFIYTTMVSDADTGVKDYVPYMFEELKLKTKMPEYSISVHKISTVYKTLTYKVDLQDNFPISKVNVTMSLSSNKSLVFEDTVDVVNNKIGYITGKFDITDQEIDEDTIIKLTVKSVETSNGVLPINSTSTVRFGGNYGKHS